LFVIIEALNNKNNIKREFMSTNINTRVLELVGSAWKEAKERVSASCTVLSDLINRVSLVAIREGAFNCYTATKRSMVWLAHFPKYQTYSYFSFLDRE